MDDSSLLLMVGQQFSGINAVLFFSVSIFEAAKTTLNSFLENIIVAGTQVRFFTDLLLTIESILPNFDFFVFLIFACKLGHFKAQTIFSYATNTQS
jgi:hypothetical protein